MHDVIIIGGGYAGLAAALQLGRARRSVLILDAGQRRNRFASAAHGFLTQDGESPDTIAERGRADVLAYETVSLREARVSEVRGTQDQFRVVAGGEEHHARRIVLATGISDALPDVPGLRERWGSRVFHCPYCHGFELQRGRVGTLAVTELSIHQAVLAAEWAGPGLATLFVNGAFEPTPEQLADLAARRITVERRGVRQVTGTDTVIVELVDDTRVTLDGLFVAPRSVISEPFAEQLGCELDAGPAGPFYKTDMMKETTVPGVFACGDVGMAMGSVTFAVGDGARAGIGTHASLVFRPRA